MTDALDRQKPLGLIGLGRILTEARQETEEARDGCYGSNMLSLLVKPGIGSPGISGCRHASYSRVQDTSDRGAIQHERIEQCFDCQSARNIDPLSASNIDPSYRRSALGLPGAGRGCIG